MQSPVPAYRGNEPYVYLSYAPEDASLVHPILQHLHEGGVKVFYDSELALADGWHAGHESVVGGCERVLYFASAASVASDFCQHALSHALDQSKRVCVVYLHAAALSPTLEFSLSGEQGLYLQHHSQKVFFNKLEQLLQTSSFAAGLTLDTGSANLRRTPAPYWWILVLLCVGLVGLVSREFLFLDSGVALDAPPVIAIGEIRNLTGVAEQDWLSQGLSNLVRDGLSASRHLIVVSHIRWTGIQQQRQQGQEKQDQELSFALARAAGINYVLSGEILNNDNELTLNSRVTDLATGLDLNVQEFRDLSSLSLVNRASELTLGIKQSLNIPHETQVDTLAADFRVTNLAAYEAYVAGLQFYNRFDYEAAAESMRAALTLEPGYAMAAYRLGNIQASSGQLTAARNTLANIPIGAVLSEREAGYVKGLAAMLAEDTSTAIAIYQEMLVRFPFEIEAQQFLAEALFRAFEDGKAVAVLRQLAKQEPENHHVWAAMTNMLLSSDQVEPAREASQNYQRLAPKLAHPWEMLGSVELKAGNFELAESHYTAALLLDPDFTRAQIGQGRLQLLRGAYDSAEAGLSRVLLDPDKSQRDRVQAAFSLNAMYNAQGKFAKAAQVLGEEMPFAEELAGVALTERALAHMRMGDIGAARQLVEEALHVQVPGATTTRALFCRGLVQLAAQDHEAVRATVAEIEALPEDNRGGALVAKALAYLRGMNALQQGQSQFALDQLQQAVKLIGYEYRIYRLGLATALYQQGDYSGALAEADKAFTDALQSTEDEPRLEIEIDRRQAAQLGMRALEKLGRVESLAQRRAEFARRWHQGDGK